MTRITLNLSDDHLDWRPGSGGTVEVYDIVVSSVRRCGQGHKLINRLIDEVCHPNGVTRLWAITRAGNFVAQQFYEALRFRSVPLRDFYGEGGVDAVMYIRDLESKA